MFLCIDIGPPLSNRMKHDYSNTRPLAQLSDDNQMFAFSQIFIYFLLIYLFLPGNDLDSFPVDVAFMSSIRKRISLAKQIDKEEHM